MKKRIKELLDGDVFKTTFPSGAVKQSTILCAEPLRNSKTITLMNCYKDKDGVEHEERLTIKSSKYVEVVGRVSVAKEDSERMYNDYLKKKAEKGE